MKIVITGGRNEVLSLEQYAWLDRLHKYYQFTEIVTGYASGVDTCARQWAESRNIPYKPFLARWKELGKAAGPVRNKKLAQYADICIVFPGGKGTQNMRKQAIKHNLTILDWVTP